MPTTIADRAERTAAEFGDTARTYIADLESLATRALDQAEATASALAVRVTDAVDELGEDETEARSAALGIAAGIALVGAGVWYWRRRKQQELEEALYEESADGVPGWTDPRAAFADQG